MRPCGASRPAFFQAAGVSLFASLPCPLCLLRGRTGDWNPQPIVRWSDMLRQFADQVIVIQFVGHVGEKCLAWLQLANQSEGGIQVNMRRVWFASQGGQHERIQSLQQFPTGGGNGRHIGTERHVTDPVSQNRQWTVFDAEGQDWQSEQRERGFRGDAFEPKFWGGILVRVCRGIREGIGKRLSNLVLHRGLAVDWNGRIQAKPKDAQIIEPHDVIGVGVGHDGRADQSRFFADKLQAQFRTGINHEFTGWSADQHGGSHALISGVIRRADPTIAANHGHTDACPGAHDDHFRSDHR